MLFISCEEILFVDDISEQEVSLYAPSDGAVLFSTGINLSWDKVKNADKYHLQIAKPNFTTPAQIVLDTLVNNTNFTQQLNIGKYEWRIKAVNSGYETAYKTWAFEILNNDDFQDNTVVLLSPANSVITKNMAQILSWQNIIGASEYQLQIQDGNNIVIKEETTSSTTIDYIFPNGNFSWKVRASNGSKETLYSTRTILVDNKAPNTPILSSPVNGSTTVATDITFQFARALVAGSTETDSIYVYNESALTNLNFKDKTSSTYNKTLTSGTYYWYVQSFDEAGNSSPKSTVFNFTIN
jgi:predicted secreted protein